MAFIGNTNTTQAFTPAVDFFSGNASTTAFTLSRPVASVAQVQAVISNVPQDPGSAYTVSGNTITFTSAPPSGTNNIYVYYTSPITQVIAPGQGTVTSESFGAIVNFTTTGNTVLGDASTDTLNVGNGGLVKDASGNVGIGTSSPSNKLDVFRSTFGGSNTSLILSSVNSASAKINFAGIGYTVDQGAAGIEAGSMYFSTYGSGALTERARIDSSGNLLVGTTSTSVTSGGYNFLINDGGTGYSTGYIGHATGAPSGYAYLNFKYAGTTIGTITQNGTTAVAYNTSSDYRLKNTIAPMTGALAKVAQLKPVTYKWNADGSDGQGFIAHELQEVVPDCVTGEKDAVETYTDEDGNEQTRPKYQGVDTSFLVATLTAAIQEQQAIITALTERITALENT